MKLPYRIVVSAIAWVAICAPALAADEADAKDIDFVQHVRPILQKHCYACHGAEKQKSELRLDIKAEALAGGESYGPIVVAGNPKESPLIQFVADADADLRMPPEGDRLSPAEIATLTNWVESGAVWPDGVDLAVVEDRRDHWSLKPLAEHAIPTAVDQAWPRGAIDHFIQSRLESNALKPAPEADRLTWLRRVYFDLIGLPPTTDQIDAFLGDRRHDAYERVVEQLLDSPRYGERWAQHWLDVVRYADTHGFEVNTERPNAWPYRDYVIAAFNDDVPYDRFVREQLSGDALGKDAATGFLVTAAVLLPGQIGQDDASKRLARQDALDEIIINTGEAFLGLSIGCARCHDHKFDAISQRDYYAMQAFFSGVQYGDRPLQSPQADARRQEADELKQRIAIIDRALESFEPVALLTASPRQTTAASNEERFDTRLAKFVRFSIHDANLHPSLGLIEPCIDEFEIFTDEESPRNVALATAGTKVTASGSRTSSNHRLEHINDGKYGNSWSWMSDEPGRGWVLFELPEPTRIDRIVWSRDRDGQLTDRLPIAYAIEVGPTIEAMERVAFVPPLRAAVNAMRNVDRFEPVTARRLRFTIRATNSLEPCIDELEVFDADGRNVALAEVGTTVSSSGDAPPSDHHKLPHINDGRYGNARSWMSSESGKGWIELCFSEPRSIDRVVWARDREGKYADRLPIDYAVDVQNDRGEWQTVADSNDRRPFADGESTPKPFSTAGLVDEEAREAQRLLDEKKSLVANLAAATADQMVYAGQFTNPTTTKILFRGDPEQPRETVAPTVLAALGTLQLPETTPDQQRRAALGAWIADPQNPLTARVMANRIWQWHFGVGLVETASDFGRNGAKPSHAELLDWLAGEFIRSGWSVKHMHRLIVLSATYRQSNRIDREAQAKDADVRLLWRFPSRRLEAEAIRDGMLVASDRLNLTAGGPGFDLFRSRGGLNGFPPIEQFDANGRRRMIYAHKIRMERDAVFGAFDCPDAGQSMARRRQSTTPIQALNLLNSRFTIDEAEAFAARIAADVGRDTAQQIRRAYRIAFGREPDDEEIRDAEPVVREHGLPTLCRVLYNSNEFLFLP